MSRTTLGIITGLLILLCAYLFWQNRSLQNKFNTQKQEFTELQTTQEELDANYQAALASIEGLRSDNTELNTLIDNQKAELLAQKKKVDGLIWSKRELDKAREEIKSFESLTAGYLAEINDLKQRTALLEEQNSELTTQNTTLSENLTLAEQSNIQLQETRASLLSEKDVLTTTNASLAKKVEIGSAINIDLVSFEGGDYRNDGSFNDRRINRRMDLFRTCFRTETNVVVPSGEETFYLRIITPSGETMANDSQGSGVLEDKTTGKSVRYTMSGTLSYENKETDACMDWKLANVPDDGIYTIEFYNKGYKVGVEKVKL